MSSALLSSIWDHVLPQRISSPYAEATRARLERLVKAADIRSRAARDETTLAASIVGTRVLRDATEILTRATCIARGEEERVDRIVDFFEDNMSQVDRQRVTDAIHAASPMYFDDLDSEERSQVRIALKRTARHLRSKLETRTTAYLRGARVGRIAAVVVLAVWLITRWVSNAFPQVDVALHKSVTANVLEPTFGNGAGLVDGIKDGSIGAATRPGLDSWVMIDLGAAFSIDRVVVYNRGDYNLDDSLPYTLTASEDGRDWDFLQSKHDSFGDGSLFAPPWTVKTHFRARYIRVQSPHYVALSEVEVFGQPQF